MGRLASQTTSQEISQETSHEIGDYGAECVSQDVRDGTSAHLEYHPCSQESEEFATY